MAFYDLNVKIGHGIKLPSAASIYTAEACAVLAALEYIEYSNVEKWIIVTDSMSVLEALSNPCHNAKTNYIIFQIKEKYHKLCNMGRDIILFWTPSHVGVVGNEEADTLAKLITNTSDVVPVKKIKISYTDCSTLLKELMKKKWLDHWQESIQTKGKWYHQINHGIGKPWFTKGTYKNRKFYSYISRLRIGHGRFNEHLHRMNMITSPSCSFCNQANQSLHHIFFECSIFSLQRLILIEDLLQVYKEPEVIPRSLPDLLKNENCFVALYKFLVTTKEEI
ncbi:uncharacterized protein LOC114359397 isoform X2 [Ostrinia furnacalis]|uniref:uncharacterized protein LOC114359397 isoform X1 n=1 Tax=Ostrinia furnacalis TaxID=93504 RepID=UPI00103CB2D4|nr:uncharacterized protein LOC114359397 isoform X1 [Ostrinia furnacalis]XP_028169592.1 uncharacterized protein LOC114359397 isoform X2 [Ostrinia furnacalis]